jgi:hypothetical protein
MEAVLGFSGRGKKKPGGGDDAGGGKQACHVSCPFIFEKRDGMTHAPTGRGTIKCIVQACRNVERL